MDKLVLTRAPAMGKARPELEATEDTMLGVTGDGGTPSDQRAEPVRGDVIGRYVVLSRLGAGGMGVVFGAYDPELDRKIALKLLHTPTGATTANTGKFRLVREAQAMARLGHPNVVTVHDVGEHEGRIFVAMEFVDGRTLRQWWEESPRTWRQVRDVFVQAGRGLVAAHAQGLVHRDFKPDNVMIDIDGRVRVMDFGLARAAGVRDEPVDAEEPCAETHVKPTHEVLATVLTKDDGIVGTPAYMAPEQHSRAEVGPAADQFAFCVALYQGLYGQLPFEGDNAVTLAVAVLQGELRPPPAADVPMWLHRVVVRGLSVDSAERWPSMDALVTALSREPRRRRRWLAGAGVLVAAVGAGYPLMRQYALARCDEQAAAVAEVWGPREAAQVEAAFAASGYALAPVTFEKVAPTLDAYARTWSEVRRDMCLGATSVATRDETWEQLARNCLSLDLASLRATVQALSEPDERIVDGAVLASRTLPDPRRCLDERWLSRSAKHAPDTAATRELVADLRTQLSIAASEVRFGQFAAARARVDEVLQRAEQAGLGPVEARAALLSGELFAEEGALDAAKASLRRAYFTAGEFEADEVALRAAIELAELMSDEPNLYEAAMDWVETARMFLVRVGLEDEREAAAIAGVEGIVLVKSGDYARAVTAFERSLAIRERLHGAEHPRLVLALNNLGDVQRRLGRYDEALESYERAVDTAQKALGAEHPEVADALGGLGNVRYDRGEYELAREAFERALAIEENRYGPEHLRVAYALNNLANAMTGQQHHEDALALYLRALEIKKAYWRRVHPGVAVAYSNVGVAYDHLDQLEEALASHEEALRIRQQTLDPVHPQIGESLNNAGYVHARMGHHAQAIDMLTRAIDIWEQALGADHPYLAYALTTLGRVYTDREEPATAIDLLRRALSIRQDKPVAKHLLAETRTALADALFALGDPPGVEEAGQLLQAARDTYAESGDDEAVAEIDARLVGVGSVSR